GAGTERGANASASPNVLFGAGKDVGRGINFRVEQLRAARPCQQGLEFPFVKASPEAQLRLLELADLDTELSRLAHRRRALPENAELEQLTARAAQVRDEMTRADTELSDLDREQARSERDVEQVRVRIDKDQQRLDAGKVSNARELESLQSEIASLRRR